MCLGPHFPSISHWIRASPDLGGLILTNGICKDPVSKQGTILAFQMDMPLETLFTPPHSHSVSHLAPIAGLAFGVP